MYFSFNFAWDSIELGFVRKNSGVAGSLLNRQNLLSVMKVICWRFLKEKIAQTLTEIRKEIRISKCQLVRLQNTINTFKFFVCVIFQFNNDFAIII